MRVLFSSTPGYGHLFPMVPLARALKQAGHTVLWATGRDACGLVTAAGIEAVAAGLTDVDRARAGQELREGFAGRPDELAAYVFPRLFGAALAPAMLRDLLPLASGWQPDIVVHEQGELAGPVVAAVLGVPNVTHAFGSATPAESVAEAAEQVAPLWVQQGLPVPELAGCYDHLYLDICPPSVQTVPMPHVTAVQPLRPVPYNGVEPDRLPAGVDRADGRPLVYLTLGTVHYRPMVLRAAAAALAERGLRLLVTVGPAGDPAALGPQPENVTVARYVAQTAVLPRCAAVVSHGGSGTLFAVLGLGLPQVCLPQAADQFRNAAGCTRAGAGVALRPDVAEPAAIADAVELVLTDPGFRLAAEAVRDEIALMPAPEDVVDRFAQLVRVA